MTADQPNSPLVINRMALPAALFTAAGKRTALVEALDATSARVAAGEGCPDGSVAILVRHGIRVFGTLHRTDEGARFDFDDPLDGWRQARFLNMGQARRPVIVAGGGLTGVGRQDTGAGRTARAGGGDATASERSEVVR